VYLALGLWLGALVFFGAVLAPIAFSQLPPLFRYSGAGIHAAGLIVGGSLVRLHWMGLFCGLIFLVVSVVARAHYRSIIPQAVLVLVMMLLTAYSQFSIIPRMDTARESVGGNVDAVAANNPGRQIFDRLHQRSSSRGGSGPVVRSRRVGCHRALVAAGDLEKSAVSLLAIYLSFAPQGLTQQKSLARKRRLPGRRVP
jgi:hypothetical protein